MTPRSSYVEFTQAVPRGRMPKAPALRVRAGGVIVANKAATELLQLGPTQNRYSVYIDRDRKLIGIDAGTGRRYLPSRADATCVRLRAVEVALTQVFGLDLKKLVGSAATLRTKNLHAPLLAEFGIEGFG